MFKKVLVGFDGEAGGNDALTLAQQLAAPDGEVKKVHVRLVYPGKLGTFPEGLAGTDELGHEGDEPADVESVLASSVGRGLHIIAEEEQADLLVIGSTRHGIVGRVLMGNDTQEALNGSPCAVAVAPAGYAHHPHELRQIAVGYNDSPESEHALSTARELASHHHAKVSAMEVVGLPTYMYATRGMPLREVADPLLNEARARMDKLSDVETAVVFGYADEELVRLSGDSDLIMVGSRGYGPLGRIVHSSVSRHLAHAARCPLLVLTRAGEEPDAA